MLAAAPTMNPPDVIKLASLYKSSSPPLIHPIQHPKLLQGLVSNVFSGGPKKSGMNKQAQEAGIDLLAHATSMYDGSEEDLGVVNARYEATKEALKAALQLGEHAQGKLSTEDARSAYQVC
eukprot:gene8674-34121_t